LEVGTSAFRIVVPTRVPIVIMLLSHRPKGMAESPRRDLPALPSSDCIGEPEVNALQYARIDNFGCSI
jgi:hypothetical protein